MSNLFKSRQLQNEFETKGYVQIPLLGQEDITRLSNLFLQHNVQYNQPFHTSHFSSDLEYKREVNDAIIEVVFPRLAPVLEGCRPVFGNLMIKQGNSDYFMPLHSDWTYVDENNFRSVAVWIPLVDTDEHNGCLGVIEGSHKIMSRIRGPRIQVSSYNHDTEWIAKLGKLLPAKAGHAIIYDHALMHYSPANKSNEIRPALNLSLVPTGAGVIHYCLPEGAKEIEVYNVTGTEFYLRYNNYQRPETNSLIKTMPTSAVTLIDEKMEKFGNAKKKNFLARFFG